MLRRLTALSLYLGALSVGTGLLPVSVLAWRAGASQFAGLDSPRLLAAGAIAQLVLMVGAWLGAGLLWRHARDLGRTQQADRDALRVIAVVLRVIGDFGALSMLFGSIAVAMLVAVAGDHFSMLVPELALELNSYPSWLKHIVLVVAAVVLTSAGASLAAMMLLGLRGGGEAIELMLDLADDTRAIRQRATWDGPGT